MSEELKGSPSGTRSGGVEPSSGKIGGGGKLANRVSGGPETQACLELPDGARDGYRAHRERQRFFPLFHGKRKLSTVLSWLFLVFCPTNFRVCRCA